MVNDKHDCAREGRPANVDRAEERAWIGFYERVDQDPALAIELMALLDADPDSKRRHLALYVSCKQSVRSHKAREARDRRIAELMQATLRALILQPLSAARSIALRSADLLAACGPANRTLARAAGRTATKPTEAASGRNVQRLTRASGLDRDGPPEKPQHEPEAGTPAQECVSPAVPLRR